MRVECGTITLIIWMSQIIFVWMFQIVFGTLCSFFLHVICITLKFDLNSLAHYAHF